MRTIKRYPNRLLYDPEVSRFVTGESLREYIRHGIEFEIRESRSDKDVTVPVLSQVLVDDLTQSQSKKSVIQTIRGFIALKGEFTVDILKKTVLASVGMFDLTKKKAEEIVDALIKQGEVAKTKRADAILELLDKADESGRSFKDRISKDVKSTIESMKVARKKDLDELSAKVDELSAQLKAVLERLDS